MIPSISWVHIGDLHMDQANDWLARGRLRTVVAEINEHLAETIDFVFLPGDIANHATADQYRAVTDELAPLSLPVRAIPGDHDFETGDLAEYDAAFTPDQRPEVEVIAGHRCIFLDIVSTGAGGPDFRLTMHHRNRLLAELARAAAAGQPPLVFMHAFPADLAADADMVARALADARVAFVDTGHTHYNELLNDGHVVYGATRSTAEIEEGGGIPGFSLVTVHDTVPSWRFKPIGGIWPFVQIVAPADLRMVTRPSETRQVPRPGAVTIVAKLFGAASDAVTLGVDGAPAIAMTQVDDTPFWQATVTLDAGLHDIVVDCGADRDRIAVLVRAEDDIPRRVPAVALGHNVHAIGAWPDHGIEGTQLGPNRNGKHW